MTKSQTHTSNWKEYSPKQLDPIRRSDMTWRLGKWKGKVLYLIPTNYLDWALRKLNLTAGSRNIIEEELATRTTKSF